MDRAVNYYRVSSDEQVASGAGLGAQQDACRRYVALAGLDLVGEFEEDEAVSGDTPPERCPALVAAVGALKRGDTLVVAKRDRLARDRMKIAMIEGMIRSRKCRLISAAGEGTETADPNDPVGFLTRGIVDLFAEFEKMTIRFRTSAALKAKRVRGERNGRTPYGWDLVDDGRRSTVKIDKKTGQTLSGGLPILLVPNPTEQAVLRQMAAGQREGYSLARIADTLNNRAFYTKAGKPWERSSVHYVLKHSIPLLPKETTDAPPAEAATTHVAG